MQVCLEGHMITDRLNGSPEQGKAYCPKDGSKTISACAKCNNLIPGSKPRPPGSFGHSPGPSVPDCCEFCGSAYPWTGKKAATNASLIRVDSTLMNLFDRFPIVARQLRQRYSNRDPLDVTDEYDVQDLLHALLRIWWDDVREEEWTPSYAGKAARVDFFLPDDSCVIEVKMARKGLTQREVGDQLIVDIARYGQMANCSRLYCFVYDPDGYIKNPRGVEADLSTQTTENLMVKVFIRG